MGYRDLNIKEGYDSGFDNCLRDFYVPVLKETKYYDRIAGFFSSSSLSIAAKGIMGLIKNCGHIRMIVSPRLSSEDIEMMELASRDPDAVIAKVLCREFDGMEGLLQKRRVEALGWLLANNYLEIRVATVFNTSGKLMSYEEVEETGLFHIKVGVMRDENGDCLTFSGSINETASAWKRNIEEFKVYKYWEEGQKALAQIDIEKFESYWNGKSPRVKISNLPQAVSERMIQKAPRTIDEIEDEIIENEDKEIVEIEEKKSRLTFKPFEYQLQALSIWQRNRHAIFEMATGTGKTKTAEVCIDDFLFNCDTPAVVFIICPQDTLAKQWLGDIQKSGLECENYVIADSTNNRWRDELTRMLLEISVNPHINSNRLFVFSTFDTYCSGDFIRIVSDNKLNSSYFIIGDEAHGLGSFKRSQGFLDIYDYRLGLSATPDRWFDDYGTKLIVDFFGTDRFTFTIEQALHTINPYTNHTYLTPYDYIPRFVSLTEDEIVKYKELTQKIVRTIGRAKNDGEVEKKLENLMFIRADIHKSAENKMIEFERILDQLGRDISNTIVFVSPGQIDQVMSILTSRHIRAHSYTSKQGKAPEKKYGGVSEREHIIQAFKDGDYQVLVAMKCLDEGIDIPSAETGIILASSTNPREYVQRIGRIIRYCEGKEKSRLYDVIIEPSWDRLDSQLVQIERKVFQKEMARIKDISENATNRLKIIDEVYSRE